MAVMGLDLDWMTICASETHRALLREEWLFFFFYSFFFSFFPGLFGTWLLDESDDVP